MLQAGKGTKKMFADRWGISTRTVENMLREGLPHIAIGNKCVRLDLIEADEWLTRRHATIRFGAKV